MSDPLSSCSNSEPFALQVLGNSMEPEFPDQCIVVVEPWPYPAEHGMYVMAMVEDTRWFRQYLNDEQGERLVALNQLYPDIPLAGLEWKLEGVIVQRNIKLDHAVHGRRRDVKKYDYAKQQGTQPG